MPSQRSESGSGLDWLLESVPDALLVANESGRIEMANARMGALFGYGRDELVGMSIEELVPERLRADHARDRERYNGSPVDRPMGTGLEIVGRRKDGSEFPADVQLRPRHGATGVITIAAVRDMTRRDRLEEERRQLLAQAERARHWESLVQLAGGLAHDFNNLLAVILSSTDQAANELGNEPALRGCLREIGAAGRAAADLTRQMVAFAGGGRLWVRPVRLSDLARGVAEVLGPGAGAGPPVCWELDPATPVIEGDPDQLRALIGNLIRNACEAMEGRPGEIRVETGRLRADRALLGAAQGAPDLGEGPYAFLRVQDRGHGMDAETRARLFEPFFTTRFVGRGMGMAAVLGIVRGHGGAIAVESFPAEGTSVTVLFPPRADLTELDQEGRSGAE